MENKKNIKVGTILQSYADNSPKYKLFLTESIEILANEIEIGAADSYQEACKTIKTYFAENNIKDNNYWRFLMNDGGTFIDYGSWSKFIAIVPPVPMKEMMGENED